jgi:hypothetical protein
MTIFFFFFQFFDKIQEIQEIQKIQEIQEIKFLPSFFLKKNYGYILIFEFQKCETTHHLTADLLDLQDLISHCWHSDLCTSKF